MDRSESTQTGETAEPRRHERYGIRYEGHDVEVGVAPGDASAVDAQVFVDGARIDPGHLRARSHEIGFETHDGVEIRLHLAGRAERPLGRVALRRADGYWVDLAPRDEPGAGQASPSAAA